LGQPPRSLFGREDAEPSVRSAEYVRPNLALQKDRHDPKLK